MSENSKKLGVSEEIANKFENFASIKILIEFPVCFGCHAIYCNFRNL